MKVTKRAVCCLAAAVTLAVSLYGCSDEVQEAGEDSGSEGAAATGEDSGSEGAAATGEDSGSEGGVAASDGWSAERIGAIHGYDRVYLVIDEETGVEYIYAYDPGTATVWSRCPAISITPRLDADGEVYVRGAAGVDEE